MARSAGTVTENGAKRRYVPQRTKRRCRSQCAKRWCRSTIICMLVAEHFSTCLSRARQSEEVVVPRGQMPQRAAIPQRCRECEACKRMGRRMCALGRCGVRSRCIRRHNENQGRSGVSAPFVPLPFVVQSFVEWCLGAGSQRFKAPHLTVTQG